jgi:4-carboxymuconolactone decarboxylase
LSALIAVSASPYIVLHEEDEVMTDDKTPMRAPWSDIAPRLAEITDTILFDDVWRRPGLSPRDRSLITVASLIALYRGNELPFHLKKALENGVSREEIIETITHLAFYSGWPTASTAIAIARQVFEEWDQSNAEGR